MSHAFAKLDDSADSESSEVESSESSGAGVAVSGRGHGKASGAGGLGHAEGRITASGAAQNAIAKFTAEAKKIKTQLDSTSELMNEIRGMGNQDLYKRGGKGVDAAIGAAQSRLVKTEMKADGILDLIEGGASVGVITARTKVLQGSAGKLVDKAKAVDKAVIAFKKNVDGYIADGRQKNAERNFDLAHPYASRAMTVVGLLASGAGLVVTLATAGAGSVIAAPIIAAVKAASALTKKGMVARDGRSADLESLLSTGADSSRAEKASDLAGYALTAGAHVAEHFGAVGASAAVEHGGTALKALTSGNKVGKLAQQHGHHADKLVKGAGGKAQSLGSAASKFSPQGLDQAMESGRKEDGRNLMAVGEARDMLTAHVEGDDWAQFDEAFEAEDEG